MDIHLLGLQTLDLQLLDLQLWAIQLLNIPTGHHENYQIYGLGVRNTETIKPRLTKVKVTVKKFEYIHAECRINFTVVTVTIGPTEERD